MHTCIHIQIYNVYHCSYPWISLLVNHDSSPKKTWFTYDNPQLPWKPSHFRIQIPASSQCPQPAAATAAVARPLLSNRHFCSMWKWADLVPEIDEVAKNPIYLGYVYTYIYIYVYIFIYIYILIYIYICVWTDKWVNGKSLYIYIYIRILWWEIGTY